MENNPDISKTYSDNENIYKTNYNAGRSSYEAPGFNIAKLILTAKGGNNVFHYLKSYNLFKEPCLMLLPVNHHYYYDENDLKNVRTLINLEKLNLVKDLDIFLHTLYSILPPHVNLIGCFSDSKTLTWNGFFHRLAEKLGNFLDSRTDNAIDKKYVTYLLEKHGFKVIDMSEMDGLTYFYSQNSRTSLKISA